MADDKSDLIKTGPGRRSFLRAGGLGLVAAGLGGMLEACSTTGPNTPVAAGTPSAVGKVNMLGWQGYDDAKARKPFEAKGGKLQTTYISSNDEIITKLRGGALGVYDVVTPNMAYLPALVLAGLIQPLDYGRLPNAKGYMPFFSKPSWNTFKGHTWGAPIQWGDEPLVYRPDLMKRANLPLPASWFDLADPKYKGKLAMWDDMFGHTIVISRALGFHQPNRITRKQLDEVTSWNKKIRQNARVIAASLGDLGNILASGDALLTTQANEVVALEIRRKGKSAKWYTPKEGSWGWCDHYCIPKQAPNVDGAYEFINTMISPQGNATLSNDLAEGTPVAASVSLLSASSRSIYDYSDVAGELKKFGFYFLPPLKREGDIMSYADWNAAWERVKG